MKFVIEIKSDKCFYCIARISYIYLNLAHWIITHVFVIRISIRFIFHLFSSPFFRSIDATACGMMQSTYNRFMPMIDYSLAAGICNLFVIGTTKLIGFHSLFCVLCSNRKPKLQSSTLIYSIHAIMANEKWLWLFDVVCAFCACQKIISSYESSNTILALDTYKLNSWRLCWQPAFSHFSRVFGHKFDMMSLNTRFSGRNESNNMTIIWTSDSKTSQTYRNAFHLVYPSLAWPFESTS